jgi:hypothetical protein
MTQKARRVLREFDLGGRGSTVKMNAAVLAGFLEHPD